MLFSIKPLEGQHLIFTSFDVKWDCILPLLCMIEVLSTTIWKERLQEMHKSQWDRGNNSTLFFTLHWIIEVLVSLRKGLQFFIRAIDNGVIKSQCLSYLLYYQSPSIFWEKAFTDATGLMILLISWTLYWSSCSVRFEDFVSLILHLSETMWVSGH